MRRIFLLLVVVAATINGNNVNRIVGGASTTIENHPSIVQVEQLAVVWNQICSGTVLTRRHILSAAHCFDGFLFNIYTRRIRAGSTYRNLGGTVSWLRQRVNHPSYNSRNYDGDLSIAELRSPLTYSNSIQPVPILARGFDLPDNLPIVQAGWGSSSNIGLSSVVLRNVTTFTINHQLCTERYASATRPREVTENMICTGSLDGTGGLGSCQGDYGGPLIYDNIVIGIASWGGNCQQFPGVNTRIASYSNWIVENAL